VIAVVDYGTGNLASVLKAFREAPADPRLARDPAAIAGAAGIVIPGVGHFDATRALDEAWRAAIRAAVARGVPLLGICLGMQWLFSGSDESPGLAGLGVFEGRVSRLTGGVKVPHVGWNTLRRTASPPLLEGLDDNAAMYFTHSFAAPIVAGTIAVTEHGMPFTAIVERGNVAGMQFHPEKSGTAGLRLIRNWVTACSASA